MSKPKKRRGYRAPKPPAPQGTLLQVGPGRFYVCASYRDKAPLVITSPVAPSSNWATSFLAATGSRFSHGPDIEFTWIDEASP